ncbi:uncharacterized protein LOC120218532 [Hibiscus syriacus]|uniref:uncharacterized protein LOC120218532 n=1 Tax=Hibiscus syriacus TaxID=106335 RepID=UPI001924B789|nr:uncharacterized protein LOC120218532 [Hibiscus syriacus]
MYRSPSVAIGSSRIRGMLFPGIFNAYSPLGLAKREARLRLKAPSETFASRSAATSRLQFIQSRQSNKICVDCKNKIPQWASVTYDVFMCSKCSCKHQGLGVHISFVQSVNMDSWSDIQIKKMESGSNDKLNAFLEQYGIPKETDIVTKYNTTAARIYRDRMQALIEGHVWKKPAVVKEAVNGGSDGNQKQSASASTSGNYQGSRMGGVKVKSRSSEDKYTRSRLDVSSAKKETFFASKKADNKSRPEGLPPLQGTKYGIGKRSLVETSIAQPAEDVVHAGIKEFITKGCCGNKSGEGARIGRIEFNNWWKEGHTNVSNGYRSGSFTLFIENLPEKIHWKRLESLFCTHDHVIDAFIPNKRNSKGVRFGFIRFATIEEARKAISKMNGSHIYGSKIRVSLAKYNPRQSYWRKSSKVVQRKSGMEVVSSNKHCEVEGVVDEDKLHMLSNFLVGWGKNFIKIGNLASQMQAKGLAGFTLMRAAGNVVLMIFEESASLRSLKNDKLEILAKWFSRVEAWSESLVVECRRVWLICEGVHFHGWNWDTFKNIAAKWGKLSAIDDSCEFLLSFDRAQNQILTKPQVRIDESLELKVGANFFKIMVYEIDPSFKPNSWVPDDCDNSLELVPSIGS